MENTNLFLGVAENSERIAWNEKSQPCRLNLNRTGLAGTRTLTQQLDWESRLEARSWPRFWVRAGPIPAPRARTPAASVTV
jgi:hypothetical protein